MATKNFLSELAATKDRMAAILQEQDAAIVQEQAAAIDVDALPDVCDIAAAAAFQEAVQGEGGGRGGLERAPRATHDAWAQDVRSVYEEKCRPNWPALLKNTEDRILSAARAGDNHVTIVDMPRRATSKKLVELLAAAHPTMMFTCTDTHMERVFAIRWE